MMILATLNVMMITMRKYVMSIFMIHLQALSNNPKRNEESANIFLVKHVHDNTKLHHDIVV